MSLPARREYLKTTHERYAKASSRPEKSRIIQEVMATLGYHRKYAIRVLNHPPAEKPKQTKDRRKQKISSYLHALPAIRLVGKHCTTLALDTHSLYFKTEGTPLRPRRVPRPWP